MLVRYVGQEGSARVEVLSVDRSAPFLCGELVGDERWSAIVSAQGHVVKI